MAANGGKRPGNLGNGAVVLSNDVLRRSGLIFLIFGQVPFCHVPFGLA